MVPASIGLSLNFTPGETRQAWEMLSPSPIRQYTTGSGTPAEIAAKLCAIVTGQGAPQQVLNSYTHQYEWRAICC